MPSDTPIIDFSDAGQKKLAIAYLRNLQGPHTFDVHRVRGQRSNAQNAYLFGCVYQHVQKGLLEAWGEELTLDEVHLLCKKEFLSEPLVNRNTGEVVGSKIGKSSEMDKVEFSHYLDKIFKWAAEYLHVEIPPAMQMESA